MWDDYGIRALIDTRPLWREEKQASDYDPSRPVTRALDPNQADTIVHTENGTLHCIGPHSGQMRDLVQPIPDTG